MQAVVAANQAQYEAAVATDNRHRFCGSARVDVQVLGHLLDRADLGRLDLARRVEALGELGRGRNALCGLDVGRVVALFAERDLVLAGRAGRQVLVRHLAAHQAHVALALVEAQAAALEDTPVSAGVLPVADVQPLLVAVEGVGVFHHELAHSQQAGARPHLVSALHLEVVPELGKLPVGAELAGVESHRLLVRHREHEVAAVTIGQPEHLGDVVAPALTPQLGRR